MNEFSRRNLLLTLGVGAGIAPIFNATSNAQGADQKVNSPSSHLEALRKLGFVGPEDDPEFGPRITGLPANPDAVAVGSPRYEEIAVATRYLFDVDRTNGPLGAARYFAGITRTNGGEGRWNAEWTSRTNPLIVGFFGMTQTLPSSGDQTAWCAAFVNFCLYATGFKGTNSALSGSFRKYGEDAGDNPQLGDIAVFSKNGPDGVKGFGHVAFFLGRNGEEIEVLGGNQVGNSGTSGAIVPSRYKRESASLSLITYRRPVK